MVCVVLLVSEGTTGGTWPFTGTAGPDAVVGTGVCWVVKTDFVVTVVAESGTTVGAVAVVVGDVSVASPKDEQPESIVKASKVTQ